MISGWTKPGNLDFLELKGPDAVRFLNGQITNDISGDLSRKVVAACVCMMKGKVEALIRVTEGASVDSLLIEVDAAQAEMVFNRLDRYLIADDCELAPMENPPQITHVIGKLPGEGKVREHWRYGIAGYDVYEEPDLSSLEEIPEKALLQQKILHGIPEYGFEITGDEFPAELGLDKWAVDFHKGCYLGQEIVSRIESVGKFPKRLRLYSTSEAFNKGHTFSASNGKTFASVVRDSVDHPGETNRFLTLVLKKESSEDLDFPEMEFQFPPKS